MSTVHFPWKLANSKYLLENTRNFALGACNLDQEGSPGPQLAQTSRY